MGYRCTYYFKYRLWVYVLILNELSPILINIILVERDNYMRIDKVHTYYNEKATVKNNDTDVVPFDKDNFDIQRVVNNKISAEKVLNREVVSIKFLGGSISNTIELDNIIVENSNNEIYKLLKVIDDKSLIIPSKIDFYDNGAINITSSDNNIITVKDFQKLLNLQGIDTIMEEKLFNLSDGNTIPRIIQLNILAGEDSIELKENIKNFYQGIIDNYKGNIELIEGKDNLKIILNNYNLDKATPILKDMKLIEYGINISQDELMIMLKDTIETNDKEIVNKLFVKIHSGKDMNVLINGIPITKEDNLLDYILNRYITKANSTGYTNIHDIQYDILLFDKEKKSLAIDLPGLGLLFIDENTLNKITYNLPLISSIYYQDKNILGKYLYLIKNINWKVVVVFSLLILIIMISILN